MAKVSAYIRTLVPSGDISVNGLGELMVKVVRAPERKSATKMLVKFVDVLKDLLRDTIDDRNIEFAICAETRDKRGR